MGRRFLSALVTSDRLDALSPQESAAWDEAVGAYDQPPEPLDAAILFAPVGDLVPVALGPSTAEARWRSPAST